MLAQVLALLAAGAQPPPATSEPPGRTLSPVVVSPQAPATGAGPPPAVIIDMPADNRTRGEYVAIWPGAAYRAGAEGRVVLTCRIDVHGLAELCAVRSESPAGLGFGAAALQLRPSFKLKPAMGPDGPVESQMDIAVKFHPPRRDLDVQNLKKADSFDTGDPHNNVRLDDREMRGNPLLGQQVTMLSRPVWAAAPGFDDVAAAYPARAGGAEGYVVVHCQVLRTGDLKGCVPVKETPAGLDFAKAALSLAARFKVIPDLAAPPTGQPLFVDIPIRLPPPAEQADRTIAAPHWLTDIAAAPSVFPPQAAARGVTSGVGVVECVVGEGGAVTQCAPQPAAPEGLGFSEAVARLASTLKVALWSDDAGPVYGGRIRLELRLDRDGS